MSNPWGDLDPEATRDEHAETPAPRGTSRRARRPGEPGAFVALARGLIRRCPRCGARGLFSGWFKIRTSCPTCGLRLEREEGGFLGAMVIGYVATALVWVTLLVVWLVIDLPDLQVAALTIASIAVAALFPLLFWPFSKTIWAGVDYLVDRTSPDYQDRAAADRAAGNGGRRAPRGLAE